MKWLVGALVGILAIVLVIAAIGATLPRTHRASRTLTLKRTPSEVWPVLMQALGKSSVPVDVLENQPPHRLVTRVKETEKMFGGTWTVTANAINDASTGSGTTCTVTITEDGWIASPIFRFMSRFVIGHHASMDSLLKQVAKNLNEVAVLSGA